ncbi:3-phosphoserine/phosphohydroxythreonine transaminase [Balneola sp. MJW-20]|uniref:3-phosphoserine/phosphohydroxythreonine transaminase n=1 Tax=Gracilimonas aurantiaca TaxID=3234185 RepID=UPI003465CC6D
MKRAHNFSAGPATLPTSVLETAQNEILNYKGSGVSIMEMSHRGPHYTEIDQQARERLTRLLGLGDDFEIFFLQGGATTQFMQVPFNFLREDETADYVNTGAWSQKAIKEAKRFGNVHVSYSSEDSHFDHVPSQDQMKFDPSSRYVHFTSNNTIFGTQFKKEPETNGIPLVCDASSDFLSRPIDVQKYGLIYAGAQKNLGPSGVTVVIVRKDFLQTNKGDELPSILNYKSHVGKILNTPPTYPIYLMNLVLGWIEEKGGLKYFEQFNDDKASKLYGTIDKDDFYKSTVQESSRSLMNVTFRLPSEDLEKKFLEEAKEHDLVALKGHRSVGGIRASIYNNCPMASVNALTDFMEQFRNQNG